MPVTASNLPSHSALWSHFNKGDFMDCFCTEGILPDLTPKKAAEIAFTSSPAWVRGLMALRNSIVSPFGLKTGNERDKSEGVFTVRSQTETEIIMGEDDKHLDFRVAVLIDGNKCYLATWVHPHNRLGWAYLRVIMPFHKLIVRSAVQRLEHGHGPAFTDA
ncbi:MAG: hypothetical protein COB37_11935 [Kordiimonadales bacterium]|nr:MAG: hypothetical protein COB37_11935 [Kordiimonadales bacterium]